MAEMVLLQCDIGSRAVYIACPKCGRICRQILRDEYNGGSVALLDKELTCPVCGSVYRACSTAQAREWSAAFGRYNLNGNAYNSAVRDNYARQQEQNRTNQQAKYTPIDQWKDIFNVSGYAEAASLERKIGRWKRELLDTGKRNKMINYRETSRSTLKILEPSLEELFNKLAISEKELTFQKPINKDTDYRTYAFLSLLETLSYSLPVHVGDIKASGTIVEREKTLKNLRSKTKLAREEQGTNILYLSFGFILWRETNRPSAAWMKAPLLMMPVSLELKSMNAPYTISRYEDDIEVNPTLDYLLNSEYGINLPTFELKDKKSITDYLDTIEEIVDCRGWKLVREVSLGLLSFQKINMYHDLNNDYNHNLIMRHPVLRSMGGDYSAIKGLPPELQNYDFDKVNPQDTYQVVNADSSQQEAILLSKRGGQLCYARTSGHWQKSDNHKYHFRGTG